MLNNEGYLSEAEATKYTTLGRNYLAECRNNGLLTFRKLGKRVLYTRQDLDNFVRRNSMLTLSAADHINKQKKQNI